MHRGHSSLAWPPFSTPDLSASPAFPPPLFVVADAFSKSAVAKIEAAGGQVQVLELPSGPLAALRLPAEPDQAAGPAKTTETTETAGAPDGDA